MSREDQYRVTVRVEGVTPSPDLGVFDRCEGGEVDSEETSYRPGGMGERVVLGGAQEVSNVTVSRLYDLARDHSIVKKLMALAGSAEMVVSKQPLGLDKKPVGDPIVYSGKLKRVKAPDHNSESSAAGLIELEMSSATVA